MKPINVGLLGIGTVGGGTFTVLERNREEISRRAGRAIAITVVADKDLVRANSIVQGRAKVIDDALKVVNDPNIDIVVELIGGTKIAKDLMLKAIENGKHVVTANKALLAQHGNEIFAAAQKKGVMVAFEAAVAGGVPIIKSLREGLAANRIEWIVGIINGTSNFILSEMREKGASFDDVLKQAQKLGYAEADPTFDIEGVDAAHKLTIMAAIGFGIPMQFSAAYTEGISKLTREDIQYAEELGYRIKLLGITKRKANGIELRVHPTLIPARRLIANVEGVMNAILVKGDAVGQTMYYGAGAGAEPTASAVVADLVDVARTTTAEPEPSMHEPISVKFGFALPENANPGQFSEIITIVSDESSPVFGEIVIGLGVVDPIGLGPNAMLVVDATTSCCAVLERCTYVTHAAIVVIVTMTRSHLTRSIRTSVEHRENAVNSFHGHAAPPRGGETTHETS